jgi:resolvase-like protein
LGQRAALYCRVSTVDQSCEGQERGLVAFAMRAGCEVVGTFKETASGVRWIGPSASTCWRLSSVARSMQPSHGTFPLGAQHD